MATYQITQVKSAIGRTERQKRTLVALGLKKNQSTVRQEGPLRFWACSKKLNIW